MTIKLMLVAAALTLSYSAPANSRPSKPHTALHNRVSERVVDSYCDGGSCERVYERTTVSRRLRDLGYEPSHRYVVRIVRDRNHRPAEGAILAVSER